jgi:hypothetical protein
LKEKTGGVRGGMGQKRDERERIDGPGKVRRKG